MLMSDGISANPTPPYVILTGNPNSGKTTLFNALTGLRAKVGNYAGVTVERKEGKLLGAPAKADIRVLDLPGTYSLSPNSLDEQISRDVLLNRLPELPPPDLIVVVVDASNLQRNLYYATQVVELGHPTLIALNMVDVAEVNGQRIDAEKLAAELSVPVQPVVASTGQGVPDLKRKIISTLNSDWEGRQVADPKISGAAARRPSRLDFASCPDCFGLKPPGWPACWPKRFRNGDCRPRRRRCCCSAMKKPWPRARSIIRKKFRMPWPLPESGSKRTE